MTTQPQQQVKPQAAIQPLRLSALIPRLTGLGLVAGMCWWLAAAAPAERTLSSAEQAARTAALTRAGPLLLAPVLPHERAQALQAMQLPPAQQRALEERNTELVWLTLWDDVDEDGDAVTVASEGFQQTVGLRHAPIRVALPRPRGGFVMLTGVQDGGGGITVAVETAGGRLGLPRLKIGQVVGLPVR